MTTEHEHSPAPQPELQRSKGISIIWTLPLLALIISGWLLFDNYRNAGIEITIIFTNASGVTAGKTEVIANGIPVGTVKALEPDLTNNQVLARVVMKKEVADILVEDTLFWIVRPELSTAGVQGLDTIFTGSYIRVQIGSSTSSSRQFNGLQQAPPVAESSPGLHLTLRAERLGSIQVGTGIYYKNIEIGSVQRYRLQGNKGIELEGYIKPEYTPLVREGSRFCNASGLTISGKIPNLKIQMESLASLIRGGILLHTPEPLLDGAPAQNGQEFELYKDFEAANFGISMTLQLASGVDIVEGVTKVMYRGIEAGFVKEIQINNDARRTVTAHLQLDPRAELILREGTVFWMVKPQLTAAGVSNLRTLLSGAHITFRPGEGTFKNHFNILPEPPPMEPLRPGVSFLLSSKTGVPLTPGAPVFHQDVQVGEVVDIDLNPMGEGVHTRIFVYQPYSDKVHDGSVFWRKGGLEFSAGANGVQLQTGPVAQVLLGGIAFTSPAGEHDDSPQTDDKKRIYPLFSSYSEALESSPTLLPPGVHFRLKTAAPGSLTVGSPIFHRNVPIGRITGIRLRQDLSSIEIDCFVEQKHAGVITADSRFYNVSGLQIDGGFNGISMQMESLQSLFKGGIACITKPGGKAIQPKSTMELYSSLEDALHGDDFQVTIHFDDPKGLQLGSPIRYKSVTIGEVVKQDFSADLQQVVLTARVRKNMAPLFTASTKIWPVLPNISISGITNLDTVLPGPYITIEPGTGEPQFDFFALREPPHAAATDTAGLSIVLQSSSLGSLEVGSPLYFRQLQIGEVSGYTLSPGFKQVLIQVLVDPHYRTLVRENSRFWNVSGVRIEGGLLSGLSVATSSIEALVKGGIGMTNPGDEEEAPLVAPGHRFRLHERADESWLKTELPPLTMPK